MSVLILLALFSASGDDDSYSPTKIGHDLWRSPAGFVYRSDKKFTGNELRRQEAAAGFDVGPVPPRTEQEIASAYGGGNGRVSESTTSRSYAGHTFRPRRTGPSQARSVTAYRPVLTSSGQRESSRLPERAPIAKPSTVLNTARTPAAAEQKSARGVGVSPARPTTPVVRANNTPNPLTPGRGFVAVVILLCAVVPIALIVGSVHRSSRQTEFTSPQVQQKPKPTKDSVAPSSGNAAKTGLFCPYCSAGPLRVPPDGRYFRCPVCKEIADRGNGVKPSRPAPTVATGQPNALHTAHSAQASARFDSVVKPTGPNSTAATVKSDTPDTPRHSRSSVAHDSLPKVDGRYSLCVPNGQRGAALRKSELDAKEAVDTPLSPQEIVIRNDGVKKRLLSRLQNVEPYEFECLVGSLLKRIGFQSVDVTSASADGGVDVRGTYKTAGLFTDRVAVQVKRYGEGRKVSRPEIQALRGSLTCDERGMVITTGDFTDGAVEEARRQGVQEITLMNGSSLIEEMVNHSFGVQRDKDGLLVETKLDSSL